MYKPLIPSEFSALDRAKIKIGTSGFSYRHWKGVFYPAGLSPDMWLEHYMLFFPVVELNVSFYRLPSEDMFRSWRRRAKQHFSFIMKLSKIITHNRRLKCSKEELERHLSRYRLLEDKLELVLVQLPGSFKKNLEALEGFLKLLPPDLKFAFEFRNISWWDEDVFRLLKEHGAGIVVTDWKGMPEEYPEGFSIYYIRRHGPAERYASRYSEEYLERLADRLLQLEGIKYVLFNNDFAGYAVENAYFLERAVLERLANLV